MRRHSTQINCDSFIVAAAFSSAIITAVLHCATEASQILIPNSVNYLITCVETNYRCVQIDQLRLFTEVPRQTNLEDLRQWYEQTRHCDWNIESHSYLHVQAARARLLKRKPSINYSRS